MNTVKIKDDGRLDGYLSVSEYAESIGVTKEYVRAMIQRKQLNALTISVGDNGGQRLNFIKKGTPKPTRTNKKRNNK